MVGAAAQRPTYGSVTRILLYPKVMPPAQPTHSLASIAPDILETTSQPFIVLDERQIRREETFLLVAITDITQQVAAQEFAEKLIGGVREGLVSLDTDLRVTSVNDSFTDLCGVDTGSAIGQSLYDICDRAFDLAEVRMKIESVMTAQDSFDDLEVAVQLPGSRRRLWVLNGRRLDHLPQVLLAIRDVTDQRDQRVRERTITREALHRNKNIIANIIAVVRQLAQRTADKETLVAALTSRLHALARNQDRLLQSEYDTVELRAVVESELGVLGAQAGANYVSEGPTVSLSGTQAQVVGMVLHELATNAAKYGALREADGNLRISWSVDDGIVSLRWREHGKGLEVEAGSNRHGFGMEVLRHSAPYMLGGEASMAMAGNVEYQLQFPVVQGGTNA